MKFITPVIKLFILVLVWPLKILFAIITIFLGLFQKTPKGITMEQRFIAFKEFIHWLKKNGIETESTRIAAYSKYLNLVCFSKITRPVVGKFNHQIDESLYALREVDELLWIYKAFKIKTLNASEKEIFLKIVGGKNFARDDENTTARNFQFELRVASYFLLSDFEVSINSDSDVVATKNGVTIHLECKRLYSPKNISKRVKDAFVQLDTVLSKQGDAKNSVGIAVFDLTKIAYKHQGLTWGFSSSHARKVIQRDLRRIVDKFDFTSQFLKNDSIILVWTQIHIPSINFGRIPARVSTCFSSIVKILELKSDLHKRGFYLFDQAFTNPSHRNLID